VIKRDECMPLLLAACPSFREPWNAYVADPVYDEELLYIHFGELARHLVDLLRAGTAAEFAAVFAVVERLHLDGDEYVREAATIGLLEGIQNLALGEKIELAQFVPHLQPETAKWWAKLIDWWDGKPVE
jgi:hypothetical protein